MEKSTAETQSVEQTRGLSYKLEVLYPVTDKHPKPDESSPHILLHFSTVYCVCVLLSA